MDHPVVNDNGKLERKFVVNQIRRLRKEWQKSVGKGVNLDHIDGSVGLVLYDICQALDFTPKETFKALG